MKIRVRWVLFAVGGVTLTLIYFILRLLFPLNVGMLPFFLVVILLDLYLWSSASRYLRKIHKAPGLILSLIFWLPVVMLLIFLVALMIRPIIMWDVTLRTFWLGVIIMFYGSKLLPIIFLFLSDILRFFKFLFFLISGKIKEKTSPAKRDKILPAAGWIAGLCFFLLLATGMIFWTHDFRVREQKIALPELPESFNGTRIVQVSDIHLGSWTSVSQFERAIKIINDLEPDYIFVTGDLANFATPDVLPFREELSKLKSKNEIFVIMGNHDYSDYVTWPSDEAKHKDTETLFELYNSLHWKLLLNQNYLIHKGNDSIAVIGVHNWGMAARFQRLGDLKKAQEGVENVAVQLLLSHDPTHWTNVVRKQFPNIDVTFSGHTHAMQFGFYLFGKEYSPSAFIYECWGGIYEHPVSGSHPQYLYVNRGLGTIAYPGRVGELPEITVFTFVRE